MPANAPSSAACFPKHNFNIYTISLLHEIISHGRLVFLAHHTDSMYSSGLLSQSIMADKQMNVFFFIGRINFLDKLMLENGFIDNIADTQHDFK